MKSLPLFHRVAGQPVIVLGEGAAAEAKRRLVQRAGGQVVAHLETGIERGARLAFVALEDEEETDAAVVRLHRAGLLVNVVDRPALCDFTTPSILDRDPVQTWQDGPVALMGDAAHAMYPTGSNGASQAIVDSRVLGAAMVERGVTEAALAAYNEKLCGPISALILRNRGAGPFGLLRIVDERCGGTFDTIDDVISPAERTAFMAGYRKAAGFAVEQLNSAPPTIAPGARVAT